MINFHEIHGGLKFNPLSAKVYLLSYVMIYACGMPKQVCSIDEDVGLVVCQCGKKAQCSTTVVCLKSELQKIRTFAFLPNRACPKNPGYYVLVKRA